MAAFADPVVIASPNFPDSETFVTRPVTADGLTTSARPLPLDTFIVVLSDVTLTPPPSSPPMSVHAVVSALKLKLPLLCASAGVTANATANNAMERATSAFICVLLTSGHGLPRARMGKTGDNPRGGPLL